MSDRVATIEELLRTAFAPTELLVKDQSHLHAGHAGSREGKGHFDVRIVSDRFTGLSRIRRHRMVYDALGTFMQSDVHALRITAVSQQDLQGRSAPPNFS
jgi:BolA protein